MADIDISIEEFHNAIRVVGTSAETELTKLERDTRLRVFPDEMGAAVERLLEQRRAALRETVPAADQRLVQWESEQGALAAPPSRTTSEQALHEGQRASALQELQFLAGHGLRVVLDRARAVAASGNAGERECWDTHLDLVVGPLMPEHDAGALLNARMELDELKTQLHNAARTPQQLQAEQRAGQAQAFRAALRQKAQEIDAEDDRLALEKRRHAMQGMSPTERTRFMASWLSGQTPDPATLPVNR